jgi:hypothetical protein
MNQTAQHLERGGLTRTIGAKETHHLASGDGEGNVPHRGHIAMATTQKVLQRAPQTRLLIRNPIALAQLFNTDERRLQSMTPVLV